MRITDVRAYPASFPIAPANRVALGIGTAVKRDAVLVKVTTDDGLAGWGEAHHGRAHTAVAKLIETTLKQLVLGMDPHDVSGVWEKMYRYQLASHGMGAGACRRANRFRDELVDNPGAADGDGNVWPLERPGLGLEVNEEFLLKHPPIEGPGYV